MRALCATMRRIMFYVWIGIGSALGGMARYWTAGIMARLIGETFPWGTLVANVLGCSFIGWFATMVGPDGRWLAPASLRLFVMTGVCGGYTTFSTFSLETLNLARDGQWLKAALNLSASLFFCLLGVWLGHVLAAAMNER
jgi:CrcB protein